MVRLSLTMVKAGLMDEKHGNFWRNWSFNTGIIRDVYPVSGETGVSLWSFNPGVLDTCLGVETNETEFHDFNLTSIEIIRNYGYPAEVHKVQTTDGYILELHRIPHGKFSDSRRGVSILLGHGLLASSVEFLLLESDSLAFVLADAGYDVWMLNFRGTTYSRSHLSLDVNDTKFWNFSWHEKGLYDIPGSIDYICEYTQRNQLLFLGHSMATTAFLVTASTRPEYQKKLQGAILLGPAAYLKYTKSPLRALAPFTKTIRAVYEIIGKEGLFKQTPELQNFMKHLCKPQFLCKNFLFLLAGRNSREFQNKILPKAVMHLPASTSVKTIAHFGQLITSGKFQQYDYGTARNMKRYNQPKPPIYNLEAITLPLSIFVAPNDYFATRRDLERLLYRLHSVKSIYVVPSPKFTHVDFIVSKNLGEIFYPDLLKELEQLTCPGTVAKHAHGRHKTHPNKAVPNMSHNHDHSNRIQNTPVDHGKISYNQADQIRVNQNEVDRNKVVYNEPQNNTPDQIKYVYNIDNTDYNPADYKQTEIVYNKTEQNNEVYSKTDYNFIDQNKVVANEVNKDNIVYKDGQYNQAIQNKGVYSKDQFNQAIDQNKVVYNKDQFNQVIQNEGVYNKDQFNQAIDQNKAVYNKDQYNQAIQNEGVYNKDQFNQAIDQNKIVYNKDQYNQAIDQNEGVYNKDQFNQAIQSEGVYNKDQFNQAIHNEGVYNKNQFNQAIDQNKVVYNKDQFNQVIQNEGVYNKDQFNQAIDQNIVVYNKDQYNQAIDQNKVVYNKDQYNQVIQNEGVYNKDQFNQAIDQNKVVYNKDQYNQAIQNEGVYNKDQYNQAIQNEGVYNKDQYNQAIDQNKVVYNVNYNSADYNPVNQNEIVYSETQQNKNIYSEADYNSINQNKVVYNEANQDNIAYKDSQYNPAIQNEGVYNENQYYTIDHNKIVYNPPSYNFGKQEKIIYTEVNGNEPIYEINYIPIKYKKVKYLPQKYKNVDYGGAQYSDF